MLGCCELGLELREWVSAWNRHTGPLPVVGAGLGWVCSCALAKDQAGCPVAQDLAQAGTGAAPRPEQAPTTPAVLLLGTASPVTPSCTADRRASTCPCHCTEQLGCLSRILGGGASTYPWRPLASGHLGPSFPVARMSPQIHMSSSRLGGKTPCLHRSPVESLDPNSPAGSSALQGPCRGHQRRSSDRPHTLGLPLEPTALLPLALLLPHP